jgi:hypothetical protein
VLVVKQGGVVHAITVLMMLMQDGCAVLEGW